MRTFLLAYLVFLAAHVVPTRPAVRPHLVARLGERGFQLAYSLISLVLLAWLVGAALQAPYLELWPTRPWQVHLALAMMPAAFALVAIGLAVPNPRSISLYPAPAGWTPRYVLRHVRHPLLIGLALWAGLHTLANGHLVSLLLFGGLAVFAVAGQGLVERRRRREPGTAPAAVDGTAAGYDDGRRQLVAAAGGVALFAVMLALHPHLFGKNPLAWW